MNMPSATISKERPVHTYAELWHASNCVLEVGLKEPEGSTWQFLSSAVLTAFTFEAYLNHIGPATLERWEEIERFSVWSKLTHIRKALKVAFPGGKGARPLKTVAQLFEFRNSLAHARSVTLREQRISSAPDGLSSIHTALREQPRTEWETLVYTSEFAQRAREDVEVVIRKLHAARTDTDDILFNSGIGMFAATLNHAP